MTNKKLHVPRIPEAAHAASEIEEEGYRSWYSLTDILIASLAPGAVVLILLALWGFV